MAESSVLYVIAEDEYDAAHGYWYGCCDYLEDARQRLRRYPGLEIKNRLFKVELVVTEVSLEAQPVHCCGASGFGGGLDDVCPACAETEARRG